MQLDIALLVLKDHSHLCAAIAAARTSKSYLANRERENFVYRLH